MFRFTIRDLLWLMVVVGLAVGWLADHALQKRRVRLEGEAAFTLYQEKMRLRQILDEKIPGWEQKP